MIIDVNLFVSKKYDNRILRSAFERNAIANAKEYSWTKGYEFTKSDGRFKEFENKLGIVHKELKLPKEFKLP